MRLHQICKNSQKTTHTEGAPFTSVPQPLNQQNKRLPQTDEYLWSKIWLYHQWLAVLRTSSSACVAINLFGPNDWSRLIILCFWKIALLIMEMEALWKTDLACILVLHIYSVSNVTGRFESNLKLRKIAELAKLFTIRGGEKTHICIRFHWRLQNDPQSVCLHNLAGKFSFVVCLHDRN